ncbi:MAG TPA: hypothetical protein VHB79_16360 [Polyangiaceae bacterium]|nr:hypothetical protein [Polyangiaceae bacterium]
MRHLTSWLCATFILVPIDVFAQLPAAAPESAPAVAPTPEPPVTPSPAPAVALAPAPAPPASAAPEPARPPEPKPKHKGKGKGKGKNEDVPTGAPDRLAPDSFTGDPFGDDLAGTNVAGPLSFRVLMQTRYRQSYTEPSTNARPGYAVREDILAREDDGFDLQRLFLRIASDPLPEVGFKAILDFAKLNNPENVLKQAYTTLRIIPKRVEIAAGLLKLPYSTMELDPIARFELSDLGATDDVIKNMGFAGRDLGVELMAAPFSKRKLLRFTLGAFSGHAKDERASPLGAIGARIESRPIKGLRLGVDAVGMPNSQDYKRPFKRSSKDVLPMPSDPLYPREQRWAAGKAYSADISYERHHFTFRSEGLIGDRVDTDERYGARSFWAVWALLAYDVHAGWLRFTPVIKAEWLDLDRDHDVGGRRELSAGVAFPYKKRVRVLVDVKRTDVQAGTPVIDSPKPLPAVPYFDVDSTRITAQLQVEL